MDQSPITYPHEVQEEDALGLNTLFSTLWRGKWWIALSAVLGILAGGYYAFAVAVPKYRSTAVVILQTNQDQIVDLHNVMGGLTGDTPEVNSEVEVLRARALMSKVVDKLDLIADPEFNADLRSPARLSLWLRTATGWFARHSAPQTPVPAEVAQQRTQDAVVSKLLSAVSVRNLPQSYVFHITVETHGAEKSARIADTIVALYIRSQVELKFEATEQATQWLSTRLADLQTTLEEAERKVAAFSASTDLVSVEGMQLLERQIKELRDRITLADAKRNTRLSEVSLLQSGQPRTAKANLAADPALTRALQQAQTDARFDKVFDTRLAAVIAAKSNDITRTEQQLSVLQASEAALSADLDRQSADLITLQQLTREAEAARVLYEYFLTRFNETSAQQGIQQADSRVLSHAVIPRSPSEPRKSQIMTMSGLLGLLIGTGLVLLREARNNTFRTARDLERGMGYPVLGQIPTIPVRVGQDVIGYLRKRPMSATAEAFRNLRTSLMLPHAGTVPQVIVITSSVPKEGKTTNAVALAQNLTGLGKKVLLVDGDVRRGSLMRYFVGMPRHSIVSVLSGEVPLSRAVFQSEGFDGDILAGEHTTTSAADLFASASFNAFLTEARAQYDAIVIDTPPILAVPDARIIADAADAVIFTVKWDTTTKAQVEESLRLFHNAGQRITGCVLGQISAKGMQRYGHGHQSGAYARYGMQYYVN